MASSYRAGLGKKATGSQVIIIQFNPSAKLGLFQRSRMTSARTSVSQMFCTLLFCVYLQLCESDEPAAARVRTRTS